MDNNATYRLSRFDAFESWRNGRVVANVANRMVEDYEVHVIGAYHSGDGEPAFAYDSRVHRLNILPKEPRIREANKELKKPLIDYIEQNHIEVLS